MNILKTNIKDNEWNMEVAFNLFESDSRVPMKEAAGKTLKINQYVIYEDENSNGEMVKLASIAAEDCVYTTSSASFIRSLFVQIKETPNPDVQKYLPTPSISVLPSEFGHTMVRSFSFFSSIGIQYYEGGARFSSCQ